MEGEVGIAWVPRPVHNRGGFGKGEVELAGPNQDDGPGVDQGWYRSLTSMAWLIRANASFAP